MLLGRPGEAEYIVHITEDVVEAREHTVDNALEGTPCIPQAEWHFLEKKSAKRRDDGGLGDGRETYWHLPVGFGQINQ